MVTFCSAFAYAIELSLATLSAAARLIGAATFALIRDIAARSGSSSPASAFSSSRVSFRYSSLIEPPLGGLVDRSVLRGVRIGDRPVGEDVRRDRGVDGRRDVRVDERHRRPLRQLLAGELVQLLARQLPVLLVGHFVPPS